MIGERPRQGAFGDDAGTHEDLAEPLGAVLAEHRERVGHLRVRRQVGVDENLAEAASVGIDVVVDRRLAGRSEILCDFRRDGRRLLTAQREFHAEIL